MSVKINLMLIDAPQIRETTNGTINRGNNQNRSAHIRRIAIFTKRMIQWHETRTSPDIMEKVIKALNESTHPCPVGIDSNERVDLSRISDLVPRGDIIFKMIASHQ